jgi:hypothetical protein
MLLDANLNDFEDFGPIPAGKYSFTIKTPAEVTSNAGEKNDIGGQLFKIIFYPEIVGGEQSGKRCRVSFSNQSKGNRYFLKSFMEKIGVTITGSGAFNSDDLMGKTFNAAITITMGKGEKAGTKYSNMDTESAVAE